MILYYVPFAWVQLHWNAAHYLMLFEEEKGFMTTEKICNQDVLQVMRQWTAKFGNEKRELELAKHKRGVWLISFCESNKHIIANIFFMLSKHHFYTLTLLDRVHRPQLAILSDEKWKRSIDRPKTWPEAYHATDCKLFMWKQSKRIWKGTARPADFQEMS